MGNQVSCAGVCVGATGDADVKLPAGTGAVLMNEDVPCFPNKALEADGEDQARWGEAEHKLEKDKVDAEASTTDEPGSDSGSVPKIEMLEPGGDGVQDAAELDGLKDTTKLKIPQQDQTIQRHDEPPRRQISHQPGSTKTSTPAKSGSKDEKLQSKEKDKQKAKREGEKVQSGSDKGKVAAARAKATAKRTSQGQGDDATASTAAAAGSKSVDHADQAQFWTYVAEGNFNKVRLMVAQGKADVDLKNSENGRNALHMACVESHHKIINFLISDAKADINIQSDKGFTALHIVAKREGMGELVRKLLALGADTSLRNKAGHTALELAEEFFMDDAVAALGGEAEAVSKRPPAGLLQKSKSKPL